MLLTVDNNMRAGCKVCLRERAIFLGYDLDGRVAGQGDGSTIVTCKKGSSVPVVCANGLFYVLGRSRAFFISPEARARSPCVHKTFPSRRRFAKITASIHER